MDLPKSVVISDEGPREGFQIEPGPIATADKVALIDALSACGLRRIQIASFVNSKHVPGWADAEAVIEGFTAREGVEYSALWFNESGMHRALAFKGKLTLAGFISLSASEPFAVRNLNRDRAGQIEAMRKYVRVHREAGVPIAKIIVMVAVAVGAVRERWDDLRIALHLHDTRGQGIACAYEGLRLGVTAFDAAVAGLGGCPFAGQPGAPGNIATEEFALLCEEMGIATGLNIEALIEAGRFAERVIGHRLPSAALRSGSLAAFRGKAA